MNIEIMRNTLYKAYLDDFAKFCNKMGGSTAAVMGDLLSFEVFSLHKKTSACLSACPSVVSGGRNTCSHLAPLAAYVVHVLSCAVHCASLAACGAMHLVFSKALEGIAPLHTVGVSRSASLSRHDHATCPSPAAYYFQ